MDEKIEARLRDIEIALGQIKERVFMLDDSIKFHADKCPSGVHKTELENTIKDLREECYRNIEKLETVINNTRKAIDLELASEISVIDTKLENSKTHFYKIVGGIIGGMTLIFTILFSLNTEKVSYNIFENRIQTLQMSIDKQTEVNIKVSEMLSDLKVSIGIIRNKMEDPK